MRRALTFYGGCLAGFVVGYALASSGGARTRESEQGIGEAHVLSLRREGDTPSFWDLIEQGREERRSRP